jgi:UDP-glucose 4-epimerase
MINKTKILVIGGCGYIGSHFVAEALSREEFEIVVIDNLSTGHKQAIPRTVPFYEVDIRDRDKLTAVFKKETNIKAVFHFAAFSIVSESLQDPLKYFNNNICGMITLLEVMQQFSVQNIIFSSTAAVYGIPDQIPITESVATRPISPYGESKLIMEKIIKWADAAHAIHGLALRYFNVAGALDGGNIGEDHRPETHLVPNILQVATGKSPHLEIFGNDYDTKDGTCIRDYIHPIDLADAHILALQYLLKTKTSHTFNLSSSHGFSVLEMVEAAEKIIGCTIPKKFSNRRAGDSAILIANSSKARALLGWHPKYDNVVDIIKTAWQWAQNHPNEYEH